MIPIGMPSCSATATCSPAPTLAASVGAGARRVSALGYLGTAHFWFESFQNWQSEFLSVWALTVLSIWFRQQGSPESKPVHAPHEQTGEE